MRKFSKSEKILIGCLIMLLVMILLNWKQFVTGVKEDSMKLFRDKDTVQVDSVKVDTVQTDKK